MKIGVLTSSRADYGIYLPLLEKMKDDKRFRLEIIAFGMHLQNKQGNTINEIIKDGYNVINKVGGMPESDGIIDISIGYGDLVVDFAKFWFQNNFDIVFALGDRWEMSAAVQASIPFELKIAHIHGGETTLGATDNIYRHQITLASTYHFTAAELFSERVISILGSSKNVYNVGSLSLENLNKLQLPSWDSIKDRFDISFDDFILVTFHPESVGVERNSEYSQIAHNILEGLANSHNILITSSNSDAMGSLFNNKFRYLANRHPERVKFVPSLGKLNYFSALKTCLFVCGNSSSGIIEAASFGKWVVNVGERQKGRLRNNNVIDVPFNEQMIKDVINTVESDVIYTGINHFVQQETVEKIIQVITNNERLQSPPSQE